MANERKASEFFSEWPLRECRAAKTDKVPAAHQSAALDKLAHWYADLSSEGAGGILALPTGGGKTFTAIRFLCDGPLSDGYKVLWLAHTHHLLEQAFKGFDAGTLGQVREPRTSVAIRVVSGTPGHFPPRDIRTSDDVVIATLQTITNAHRQQLEQFERFVESAKGKLFVVFDEAHHAPAPSYRKLLLDLREVGAPALGLTATPTYSDEAKRGWLKKVFPQGILAQARPGDLIAQEVLARPRFERPETGIVPDFEEPDYQKWLGTYRDIPEDIIGKLAGSAERNAFIAKTYADNRERYGKAIIFTDRWFQCEAIVEALGKHGVKAGAVYSRVDARAATVEARARRSRDENAKMLKRFRDNELDVLINVKMLTEGTDLPDAQTVFLTRQTTSQILMTQMVGRALRGPKFGGTADAYVVSFIDDWKQPIRWAEYDQLAEGQADETQRASSKRPPLQLISIDLVRRLARQMEGSGGLGSTTFLSLMPTGWFRVVFDTCEPGSDDIETSDQLILVLDDERKGFESLTKVLLKSVPVAFESETVVFAEHKATLEQWCASHFNKASRPPSELLLGIFHLARHIGQGHGAPEFFPFEVRKDHDLDSVAKDLIARDLGPRAIYEALQGEYARKDRFWRALFPRFEHFQNHYDACSRRNVRSGDLGPTVQPRQNEIASTAEPDEAVKEQVKRRDGHCLCCETTRSLRVDHIIPVYRGGTNELSNLQTLCRVCNGKKATRGFRFTVHQTPLGTAPTSLESFDVPRPDDASDRAYWERFLRRTLNFAFQCAAVSSVRIAGRGDGYYNWTIELVRGNNPAWIAPHLDDLVARIQGARAAGGKPNIKSLTICSPGEPDVVWQ